MSLFSLHVYYILYIIVRLLNHSVLPRSYNLNKRRYKKVEEETQRVFVMFLLKQNCKETILYMQD